MNRQAPSAPREFLNHLAILLAVSGGIIAVAKVFDWSDGALGSAIVLACGLIVALYPPMTQSRSTHRHRSRVNR